MAESDFITRLILDASQYVTEAKAVAASDEELAVAATDATDATVTLADALHAAAASAQQASGGSATNAAATAGQGASATAAAAANDDYAFSLKNVFSASQVASAGVSILKRATELLVGGLVAATGATALFAKDAVDKFAEFDTIKLQFEGLTNSAEKAGQMMEYLKTQAQTSPFHFSWLSQAAVEMAEVGLDVSRWLPIIQQLSLARGEISQQGLENVVEILRRLVGGQTALALGPRGLGRYGINENMLKAEGGQFNNRQFAGSTADALDLVETTVKDKYSAIAKDVSRGAQVTISDLGDAFEQFEIQAGQGFATYLLPIVHSLTEALKTITTDGTITNFVDTLAGIWNIDPTKNSLVDTFHNVSDAILDANYLMEQLMANVEGAFDLAKKVPWYLKGPILGWLPHFFGGDDNVDVIDQLNKGNAAERESLKRTKEAEARHGKKLGPDGLHYVPIDATSEPPSTASQIVDQASGSKTEAFARNSQEEYLRQIALNTKKAEESLNRFALGGGDLGREGVSAVDLSQMRNGTYGLASVRERLGQAIEQLVLEAIGVHAGHSMQRAF